MGENPGTIEVQIEEIERAMDRMCRLVERMVGQCTKISEFLMAQEGVLTSKHTG